MIKAKGVDTIACVSVNDPFVMGAWGQEQNVGSSVVMLADGNGDFTQAMGLTMDGSGFGLGHVRSATPPSLRTASSPGWPWSRDRVWRSVRPKRCSCSTACRYHGRRGRDSHNVCTPTAQLFALALAWHRCTRRTLTNGRQMRPARDEFALDFRACAVT